jgi:hypothetical protein
MMTPNAAGGKEMQIAGSQPFVPFAFAGGSGNVPESAPSTAPSVAPAIGSG